MPALTVAEKAKLEEILNKVVQADDQRNTLTVLLGRAPLPREMPKENEPLLSSLVKLTNATTLKGYKNLRKYGGPNGELSFTAWLQAIEPLTKDESIPEPVRKEYLLGALSTDIYNLAISHRYADLSTCEAILEGLKADWGTTKDTPTLTAMFYDMSRSSDEDLLSWVQRLRALAEEIHAEKKEAFKVVPNMLIQLNRGSDDPAFVTHLAINPPDTVVKLVETVKEFINVQQITNRLASMSTQQASPARRPRYN